MRIHLAHMPDNGPFVYTELLSILPSLIIIKAE